MTVKELKEWLDMYPDEAQVLLDNDCQYYLADMVDGSRFRVKVGDEIDKTITEFIWGTAHVDHDYSALTDRYKITKKDIEAYEKLIKEDAPIVTVFIS